MQAAKKPEEKEKIKFEIHYCDLYTKVMKQFNCSNIGKRQIEKLNQEKLKPE